MAWYQRQRVIRMSLCVLGVLFLLGSTIGSTAEAKRKRTTSSTGFKILEVTTAPTPFEVGNGDLTFSTVVNVPKRIKGMNFLEVTILLTSQTQRSMRFLIQRIPLQSRVPGQKGSHIPSVLAWDGKDQTQRLVEPGVYQYEMRAKLMAEKGSDVLSRMVSRRSRGTVEVTKYHAPEPPPVVEELHPGLDESRNDSLLGDEEEIIPEAILPEGTIDTATDEIEMLLDESTSHPVPEPDEQEKGTSEEGEVLEIPQEG